MLAFACTPRVEPRPDAGRQTAAPPLPPALPAPTSERALGHWKERARAILDVRAARWIEAQPDTGQNVQCTLSCHTTHPYLMARPLLSGDLSMMKRVRDAVAERVKSDWASITPMYGRAGSRKWDEALAAEAVLNASSLRLGKHDDALVGRALDNAWSLQRQDGAWHWLMFGLQPFEADNHDWGAAMIALTAEDKGEPAQRDRLRSYLRGRLGDGQMRLHAQLIMLWAGVRWPALLDDAERDAIRERVVTAHTGRGWSLAALGFERSSNGDVARVDGYATALVALVLCRAGAGMAQQALVRGLSWLRENQRPDGAWPAWSLNKDVPRNHGYMSDAATAYASMALIACSE